MDASRFDRLTRSLAAASSRRLLLRGLAALGLAVGSVPAVARAKKRRKKPQLNAFGCVDVGGACRGNDALCCSGICQGKKPKKGKKDRSRCVAHNVGGCTIGQDVCLGVASTCGTVEGSSCFRTTGKASFCGVRDQSDCVDCTKDTDCEAAFGQGAACLVCDDCIMVSGNTACIAPGA
ncbi:MAG: hypothetical protein ACRDJC_16355 [Thermomicrobiales bacterium]